MKKIAFLTNTMRRPAFWAAALLVFAISCKKDVSQPQPQPVPGFRLSEYHEGEDFAKFTYNPDGTVSKLILKNDLNTSGDEVQFDITYNANHNIESVASSSGETVVPVYDNNRISRADYFTEGVRTGYSSYTYNENGQCQIVTIYAGADTQFEPLLEFRYAYDAQGNCSQSIFMVPGAAPGLMVRAGHVDFQYDQKINPLYAHKELMWLFWQPVSANNIIREDHFDAQLQPEDRTMYTNQYKSNGLPDQATRKQGLPGTPQVTANISYIYQ